MADTDTPTVEEDVIETETVVDTSNLSKEEAVKELAKARQEAAARRVKLREYERKDAERTESDRKANESEALKRGEHEKVIAEKEAEILSERKASKDKERLLRDRLMERELRVHLADSIDADVCSKLIDKKMISFDPDTYEISGVEAAVALLREAKPHFFGATKPSGTNANGRGPVNGGTKTSSSLMEQAGEKGATLDSLISQFR